MKSYTDIEQSKKLAKILPFESADGFWEYHNKWYSEGDEWEGYQDYPRAEPYLKYNRKENEWKEDKSDVPCWSLAALLGTLTENKICHYNDRYYCQYINEGSEFPIYSTAEYDNPIDACYEMILKLHELKML